MPPSPPPPRRFSLAVFLLALAVPATAVLTLIVTDLRSPKAVWRSCDERESTKATGALTCAFFVQVRTHRRFPFLYSEAEHELWLTRGQTEPTYGHATRYGLHAGFRDDASWLAESRGHWDDAGFTFEEPSGHKLFVPKSAYVGGR